ncbi:MAG: hypothetical protein IPJ62_14860 [Betaproteobacteria bacterium]|nr:hypothetical protein [Betaproteobacteria bacterium]
MYVPRGELALALPAVMIRVSAAFWFHTTGAGAAPFPGHFLGHARNAAGQGPSLALAILEKAAHLPRRLRRRPVPHPAAFSLLRRSPAAPKTAS